MDIALARRLVALFNVVVSVRSFDERGQCPLCNTYALVYRTLTDAGAVLRYSRCPACGMTFKVVAPPKDSKVPDSTAIPPPPVKLKVGKKKRRR